MDPCSLINSRARHILSREVGCFAKFPEIHLRRVIIGPERHRWQLLLVDQVHLRKGDERKPNHDRTGHVGATPSNIVPVDLGLGWPLSAVNWNGPPAFIGSSVSFQLPSGATLMVAS
ncbi:hypothetical protein Pan97_11570 [Bremerella volcania]|uniref:Uncharacterized protein n=1 Tax=Bremerella volcania TaxID=2527984 RepID=A0A518C4J8_9BACT|nr:hypothetical protein Pan97_11570 [Bremerella volcania]